MAQSPLGRELDFMKKGSIRSVIQRARKHSDNGSDPEFFRIFVKALQLVPKQTLQAPFLEIGTRRGGTALLILELIRRRYNGAVLVTVDPYGDKAYDDKPYQYGSRFYSDMKRLLADYPNHIHYYLTSKEFIAVRKRISYWFRGRRGGFSKFSFIYLDGSHQPKTVKMEFSQLFPSLISGGIMLIDNTDLYHSEMDKYLKKQQLSRGLKILHFGRYAVLKKE